MRSLLQNLIAILFLTGLFTGFLGVGSLKYDLLIDPSLLYGYAGISSLLGSFFTPFIIRYTHKEGFLGYLVDIPSHFLLNISAFGANGLFAFLLLNSWNTTVCEKADYAVLDWKNTTQKMKYSAEYEAWVLVESSTGNSLLLRFEDHLPSQPKSVNLCIAKGNFGLQFIKQRTIQY